MARDNLALKTPYNYTQKFESVKTKISSCIVSQNGNFIVP